MRSWLWSEVVSKVELDLDLQDEDFITAAEMLAYGNEAIDDVEAEIHTLYEDYFLTQGNITLVSGTATAALPSTIYANKIRAIYYNDGSTTYEIKRIRNLQDIPYIETGDDLRYVLDNATTGIKIRFYPTPAENSTTNVTVWFIRNAARVTVDASTLDIPEFVNYVIQFIKVRCYEKEGHPNLPMALGERERLKQLCVETLEEMVVDDDNTIQMDTSIYYEHE